MFCGNCGAPLNNGTDFCTNCGARVNNAPVQQYTSTQKKKNPIMYIAPIVIIISIIVSVACILSLKSKDDNEVIYGEWECNDHIMFKLNSDKTFEMYDMYDRTDLYVKGDYKINSKSKDAETIKYDLTLMSNYRVVEGETYDSNNSYTRSNGYEIALTPDNLNEMVMINDRTYNIYYCAKR